MTWTAVPLKQFKILSGHNKLRTYESHPGIRWGFCGDCGTSMLYDSNETPDKIYVTVANLDGPLDREPDCHVSFEEQPSWMQNSERLPRYLGKTEERIE